MTFGLHDGGDDSEHSGINFVEISKMFATGDAFFFRTGTFGRVLNIRHMRRLRQAVTTA